MSDYVPDYQRQWWEQHCAEVADKAVRAALEGLLERVHARHARNTAFTDEQERLGNQRGAEIWAGRFSEDAWLSIEIQRMLKEMP